MKALPLFYYPCQWLLVDDDPVLLNCMAHFLSAHGNVKSFSSARECLNYLDNYQPNFIEKTFLKSESNDENFGLLKHTHINFDVTDLLKIASNPQRHNEISAMIIDYNMPEMNGLSLAETLKYLPIRKILLTGAADDKIAISGLNNHLIHCFIRKGEATTADLVLHHLNDLTYQYFQQLTAPLLSLIETEKTLPLTDPVFITFFQNFCEKNHIVEYYLIDKQGSFLCIDSNNQKSCLVVHTAQDIDNWVVTYSAAEQLPSDLLQLVQSKQKIPFFGVGKEAWQVAPEQWTEHFHDARVLEGKERYFWTQL